MWKAIGKGLGYAFMAIVALFVAVFVVKSIWGYSTSGWSNVTLPSFSGTTNNPAATLDAADEADREAKAAAVKSRDLVIDAGTQLTAATQKFVARKGHGSGRDVDKIEVAVYSTSAGKAGTVDATVYYYPAGGAEMKDDVPAGGTSVLPNVVAIPYEIIIERDGEQRRQVVTPQGGLQVVKVYFP